MYFFNFLDRNAMINGKLNSLSQDLALKGTQYNTCVSILFVGYVPSYIEGGSTEDSGTDVCKVSARTSAIKHDLESCQTLLVHGRSV